MAMKVRSFHEKGGIIKIKPYALSLGDTIGVVAPAGVVDSVQLNKGIKVLKDLGFDVYLGKTVKKLINRGYFSASDEERANDLNEMFSNEKIKAIFCASGGYGSMRILPLLDYDLIKRNPKIFVGYSDITALLIAIHQKTGLIVFHGPMVASDMHNLSEYTKHNMMKVLMNDEPLGEILNPIDGPLIRVINDGRSEGDLIGGNLSLIVSTLGTPYEIDTEGKILFIEDTNEAPYRVDRMLTQLILAGKLDNVKGIIICEFKNYEPSKPKYTFSLEEVIQDRIGRLNIPAIYGLCCGHGEHKITLPIGVKTTLDATNAVLRIDEPAVIRNKSSNFINHYI
ncbi:MAG: S66 peptidase family protein [Thermoprotei archaeon]|jgi:muramoyltetrapeptide carboxypeptidase